MLSRFAVDPIPHLAARLDDVKRVERLSKNWGHTREKQRRNAGYKRFVMPVRLRLRLDARQVKRNSKLAKKPVRKVKKRVLEKVLESSHLWSTKRMCMDRKSWFETIIASHSSNRSVSANLATAQKSCVLHDASYERWIEVKADSSDNLHLVLSRVFDEDNIPGVSDLAGTKHVLHDTDAFPQTPICPVRFQQVSTNTIRLAVHSHCLQVSEQALRMASTINENVVASVEVLNDICTFLLVGPRSIEAHEKAMEHAKPIQTTAFSTAIGIHCPLTNKEMTPKQFESHFYGQDFAALLTYGRNSFFAETSLQDAQPSKVENGSSAVEFKFDFVIGLKKNCALPARIVLVAQENSKKVWNQLCKVVDGCIGYNDLEALYSFTRTPSFPRDFPDAASSNAYWDQRQEVSLEKLKRMPKSKRGMKVPIKSTPNWNLVDGVDTQVGPVLVARGWDHISAFFEPDAMDSEIQVPNLMLRVVLSSPRLSKFGARLMALSAICLPSAEDYLNFTAAKGEREWNTPTTNRTVIGLVTSSSSATGEVFGIGHITATGLVRLLHDGLEEKRKQTKRHLFVLVRNECSSVKGEFQWGVAFMSVCA